MHLLPFTIYILHIYIAKLVANYSARKNHLRLKPRPFMFLSEYDGTTKCRPSTQGSRPIEFDVIAWWKGV